MVFWKRYLFLFSLFVLMLAALWLPFRTSLTERYSVLALGTGDRYYLWATEGENGLLCDNNDGRKVFPVKKMFVKKIVQRIGGQVAGRGLRIGYAVLLEAHDFAKATRAFFRKGKMLQLVLKTGNMGGHRGADAAYPHAGNIGLHWLTASSENVLCNASARILRKKGASCPPGKTDKDASAPHDSKRSSMF